MRCEECEEGRMGVRREDEGKGGEMELVVMPCVLLEAASSTSGRESSGVWTTTEGRYPS